MLSVTFEAQASIGPSRLKKQSKSSNDNRYLFAILQFQALACLSFFAVLACLQRPQPLSAQCFVAWIPI
jgi:hypothetical protein